MRRIRFRKIRKGFYLTILLEKHGRWFLWELKRFFLPLTVFLIILGALIFVSETNLRWAGWKLTSAFPDGVFCEQIQNGTVRQPFNAWSSVIFIPIGLWVVRRSILDKIPSPRLSPVRRHQRYGFLYGGSLVILGIGSWLFHASLTYVGHFVDVTGMYFLGGFLFTYGLSRKLRQSATSFMLAYALVILPLVFVQWFHPGISRYAFGVLIVGALGTEVILHRSLKNWLFVGALVSLGLGFAIWILDEKKLLCSPSSCLQGHAIWHVLTAVSTQFSYLYYRSETPPIRWKIRFRPGRYKAILRRSRFR